MAEELSTMSATSEATVASEPTMAEEETVWSFDFIVEGVLLTSVCVLGFFGNLMAIYVLLKPSVRGAFSALLTALVSFDALFLVCSLTTLGLPNLSETYKQEVFFHVLPVMYSLSHIFRLCSAYATVSVTLERFFAIVYPFKAFDAAKRWLIPSTVFFSVAFNVPKFFELTTVEVEDGSKRVIGTELRQDPRYKLYYLFWAKLIFTELIPYVTIVVFNSFIVVKIVQSSRFRRRVLKNTSQQQQQHQGDGSGNKWQFNNANGSPPHGLSSGDKLTEDRLKVLESQRQEHKLGGILIAISVLFIFCQLFKVFPDLYESVHCKERGEVCQVGDAVNHIVDVSHLLLCVNSSANFLIYLLGGEKFRRAWIETYCGRGRFCGIMLRRSSSASSANNQHHNGATTFHTTVGGGMGVNRALSTREPSRINSARGASVSRSYTVAGGAKRPSSLLSNNQTTESVKTLASTASRSTSPLLNKNQLIPMRQLNGGHNSRSSSSSLAASSEEFARLISTKERGDPV